MAMARADRPSYERLHERQVRMAEITLGLVTPQRAKNYGFNYEEWRKNVIEATDVEYEKMQELGRKLATVLEKSGEVTINDPDGTDLSFTLEGRTAFISDGVIDNEDLKMGASFTELPSGTLSVAPTESSTNGVLASNVPYPQAGVLIQNMLFHFENGELKSFKGDKNFEVIKAMWEKGTGDKNRIGWLSLGLNPKARLGFSNNQIVLGTATVGLGLNKELGGHNDTDWMLPVTLSKPTVKINEKIIMREGRLTV
jgi:leucyl aminopeptidase (aminopeptidase T)